MVIGWPIYNAATVSTCVTSHRWQTGPGCWQRMAGDHILEKPWIARSV